MNIDIKFEGERIVPYMHGQEITMDVSPFIIFLATAGMCSAVFVQAFLNQRGLSTEGIKITQQMNYNPMTNHVGDIDIHIVLPASFPEKYQKAIVNVVNQCPVKQHLINPPTFNVIPHLANQKEEVV
jgi:ribosomal protein S12 methylthiotransferase accessory factor